MSTRGCTKTNRRSLALALLLLLNLPLLLSSSSGDGCRNASRGPEQDQRDEQRVNAGDTQHPLAREMALPTTSSSW